MSNNFLMTRLPDGSEKKGGRKKASMAMPELEDNFVEVID